MIGLKQGREPGFDLLAVSLGIRYLVRAFAMVTRPDDVPRPVLCSCHPGIRTRHLFLRLSSVCLPSV